MKNQTERNVYVQSEGILQLSSLEPDDSPLSPSIYKALLLLSFIKSSSLPFFFPSVFFNVFFVHFCCAVSKTAPQIAEDEQIGLVVRKSC